MIFPGFWALYLANGGHVIVPASVLTPELEAFLRAKAGQMAAPLRPG